MATARSLMVNITFSISWDFPDSDTIIPIKNAPKASDNPKYWVNPAKNIRPPNENRVNMSSLEE